MNKKHGSSNNQTSAPDVHESAVAHVTGRALYVDDIPLPENALHVAVGVSSCAKGRLEKITLTDVWSSEGVVDVLTAADIPGVNEVGAVLPGEPLLADDLVEYIGQPIFAVAARTKELARVAVQRAQVDYHALEPTLEIEQALEEEAFVTPGRVWGDASIQDHLSAAPVASHSQLYIRGQEHFYLEPQAAFAMPRDDGISIMTSSQHLAEVQKIIAEVLNQPMHRVSVECRRMGGAFGGKETQAAPLAALCALFAQRLGRAVKYRYARKEDMVQTGKRHDFSAGIRLGADEDGVLQAADFHLAAKCGFSPDLSDGIVDRAMLHADNAYFIPRARITGLRMKTNTVSNTAFRGFGGPQGMLAMEAAMDDLAYRLGEEPLVVRQRNFYREGHDLTPYKQQVKQLCIGPLVEDLVSGSEYWARRAAIKKHNQGNPRWRKGISLNPVKFGISFTLKHLNQASALVHLYTDGSIEVAHGGTEMGQGLYTKVRAIVARAFGVPVSCVLNAATRTDKIPNASPTAASSGADLNGMAALTACETLKERLQAFVSEQLGVSVKASFAQGEACFYDDQGTLLKSLPLGELVSEAYVGRVHLSATGFYSTPDIGMDKDVGEGRPFYYFANGAAVSEVEVDTQTGQYHVLRTDILHDVGNSLASGIDMGQIEGGFVQGMGWLTTEELSWDDSGKIMSNAPSNYKIPTAHDVPKDFRVGFFDSENLEPTVHRSKAVGEPPFMLAISVWCALRDACASLTDYRTLPPLAVPATAEQVFHCLQGAKKADVSN